MYWCVVISWLLGGLIMMATDETSENFVKFVEIGPTHLRICRREGEEVWLEIVVTLVPDDPGHSLV